MKISIALINSSFFIVKTNMAFRRFPELMELHKKNNISIGQNYINDKGCRMFCALDCGTVEAKTPKRYKKFSLFFLCLSDGSTDAGNIENEIIYLHYIKEGSIPYTKYVGIEPIKNANAPGTLSAIETGIKNVS